MAMVSELDHLTGIWLPGSKQVTDVGLHYLVAPAAAAGTEPKRCRFTIAVLNPRSCRTRMVRPALAQGRVGCRPCAPGCLRTVGARGLTASPVAAARRIVAGLRHLRHPKTGTRVRWAFRCALESRQRPGTAGPPLVGARSRTRWSTVCSGRGVRGRAVAVGPSSPRYSQAPGPGQNIDGGVAERHVRRT